MMYKKCTCRTWAILNYFYFENLNTMLRFFMVSAECNLQRPIKSFWRTQRHIPHFKFPSFNFLRFCESPNWSSQFSKTRPLESQKFQITERKRNRKWKRNRSKMSKTLEETKENPKTHNRNGQQTPSMSLYEQSREERIKENIQRLQQLGVIDLSQKLNSAVRPKRAPKHSRSDSRPSTPVLQSGPLRRSSRSIYHLAHRPFHSW